MSASSESLPPPPAEIEYIDYAPKGAALALLDCTEPEILLEGPAGCVAPWTILDGSTLTIEEMANRGLFPTVQTIAGPVLAFTPFCKGFDAIYRVTLSSERSFDCTASHVVWAAGRWMHVCDLALGMELPSIHGEGGPSSMGIAQDSLPDYLREPYSGDEQPHYVVADDQAYSPSQSCVLGLGRDDWRRDARASRAARNRSYQSSSRLSMPDYSGQLESIADRECCAVSDGTSRTSLPYLPQKRSATKTGPLGPFSRLFHGIKSTRFGLKQSSHNRSKVHPALQVKSIKYLGHYDYYDLHVPKLEHYALAGVWHHNTGKTRAILEKINLCCETWPKTRALVCRDTRTSLTESVLVTMERDILWTGHPAMSGDASRANRHSYDYPNKSTIVCGGLDHPERLYSTEWDLVYVAEATEITEDSWEKFARAMRNHAMPYQQQISDCNPSAPGHWLNQRCNAGRMKRLVSKHEDNPSVTPDYLAGLRRLTGHRRSRLYEGLWVAAEGSVFPEFSAREHVMSPFDIPSHWPLFVGVDPGYDHPCAVLWFAVGEQDQIYIIDEVYRGGWSVEQHAKEIIRRNNSREIKGYYLDPQHGFSQTAQSPRPIAAQFRECGLNFAPWPRTGVNEDGMIDRIRRKLTDKTESGKPMLRVFNNCRDTINEFQTWAFKRTAVGDLPAGDDKYEDKNNHSIDVIKGVLATNPSFTRGKVEIYRG